MDNKVRNCFERDGFILVRGLLDKQVKTFKITILRFKLRGVMELRLRVYVHYLDLIVQEVEQLRACMEQSQDIQRHAHGRSDGQGASSK
jgi:hypothetical protein